MAPLKSGGTGSLFPVALGFDAAERFVCRRLGLNFRSVSMRRVLDGSFALADGPAIPVVHPQRVEADLDRKGGRIEIGEVGEGRRNSMCHRIQLLSLLSHEYCTASGGDPDEHYHLA